ncbi:MAG: ribonuclease D [Gammaproteobacteria bacterium]|nr:MAG: ribonuclease D [Gammaproteobacteria bacterium]
MNNNRTFYIESTTELKTFCAELQNGSWIGVDTEFMRERTYYPEPCLIQLSGDAGIACVDIVVINDLAPLKEVLLREDIVKLMHSCSQDLEIFHLLFDEIPPNIFDTQVAAAFIGKGDQLSYAALVEDICNVKLSKAHTRARWCKRPLSEEEIQYAEDDVRYLPAMYDSLSGELDCVGRREWFDAEMQGIMNCSVFAINESNAWQRMNALRRMSGRQLAAAKALAGWREGLAQTRDKPRSWILADKVLVRIANTLPETKDELASIEDVTDGLVKHRGGQLLAIIKQSVNHSESEQPRETGRPDTREKSLKNELAKILDATAEKMELPASLLATRKDLTAMIQGERELAVFQGWRAEAVGQELLDYLQNDTSGQ